MEIELETLVQNFETYLESTATARIESERDRDYRDGKQWTQEEVNELARRKQAPVVENIIGQKVDLLVGIEINSRTDPLALPRNMADEKASEAITDGLRYIEEKEDLDEALTDCFEDYLVEGTEAVIIEAEEGRDGVEVKANRIPWNRCYADPHSVRRDYSDANWMGYALWLDLDVAQERFQGKADELEQLMSDDDIDETFQDRPLWVDRERKRVRVLYQCFIHKGQWHYAYFGKSVWLTEPKVSPYLDDYEEPICPMEMQSPFRDRDNNAYGYMRNFIDMQDEVNHRRSKALHLGSVRQTFGNKGAGVDAAKVKHEMAKPDGHIEMEHGRFGEDFGIIPTNDMAISQVQMLQDARATIDRIGQGASISDAQAAQLSGRAKLIDQNSNMMELGRLFDGHSHFKRRVYRQIWWRMRQFWNEQKWFRVVKDENSPKWVGINVPVTRVEQLVEQRTGLELDAIRKQYGQEIQQAAQQDPRLAEVVEVRNQVQQLGLDISITDAPDTLTIQQEQFEVISRLAQVYGPQNVPFEVVLQLSSIRNKEDVLDKLKGDPQQAAAMAQRQQQIDQMNMAQAQAELQELSAKIEKMQAETRRIQVDSHRLAAETEHTDAETTQKELENQLLIAAPTPVTSVAI